MTAMLDLVIWVPYSSTSQTLRFKEVSNFETNDDYIAFDYHGASTGIWRKAVFNRSQIVGYAIGPADEA